MRIAESLESRFIHSRKKGWSGEKIRGVLREKDEFLEESWEFRFDQAYK